VEYTVFSMKKSFNLPSLWDTWFLLSQVLLEFLRVAAVHSSVCVVICRWIWICLLFPFFFILVQKFKEVNFLLQVVDLPSTIGSVFFELLQTALPEGMSMTVHEHKEEHEEVRYVPDVQLLELKSQLEDLGRPSKKK